MFRELVKLEVECRLRPGTERGGIGSVSSRQTPTVLPRTERTSERTTDSRPDTLGNGHRKRRNWDRVPCCR